MDPVRLSPDEAKRAAREARQGVSVEMPAGLDLTLWASERLIADPIAIDLDSRGTLYAISSTRASLPLDIRGHPTWVPLVHTLRTTEELRRFYERELSPERSKENADWILDLNKDGSHDGRDFRELKERLYRIQDTDGDGIADTSHAMIAAFNDDPTFDVAGGLLHHDGELYFGIAPGIWRLRDTDGDGTIDTKRVFSEGYNVHPAFGGHGISGITMGPDGRVYWEVGDIGFDIPDTSSKAGHRWSYPNQGAVLRANPDGTEVEVFATGIRNLQEFAFDQFGNLISVDNDGDYDGETERLVYITDGSDSGWRSNWQYGKYTDQANNRYNVWMDEGMFKPRFTGQAAYIVPPVAPYHTGPSGMVYNPGTALSPEWRNYFFVTEFPGAASNAKVNAFTLKEQGAGFALDRDVVALKGILAIGMKFGPDGALYLTDWITGWTSKDSGRLWKLDTPKTASSPERAEVRTLLPQDFTSRSAGDVAALLRHADVRIRLKAQFELVRRLDTATLLQAARQSTDRLGRVHGLWGLGQLARRDPQLTNDLAGFLKDSDAEIRAQAAKVIGDTRGAQNGEALVPVLADSSARVRFFAAQALGRMAYKPAAAPIVKMLADNDDRDVYLRHAGSLALSRIGDTQALVELSQHSSRGVRLAAIVALRRMRSAEIARFLSDRDEEVVTEAARAINDDGGIVAALPALSKTLEDRRFKNEPLLRRAVSANLRVGTSDAVARLAAFAADRGRPEAMTVDAISALGVWAAPSPLDRVDGFYIGAAAQRDPSAAAAAVERLIGTLGNGTPPVKIALADAAGRLKVTRAIPTMLAQLKGDASADVRLASMRALQALNPPNMDEVMRIALADRAATVRSAALGILPSLSLEGPAMVEHLAAALKNGSVQDQQAALDVVGKVKDRAAEALLASYVDRLAAGTLPPAIQLDVVEAARANGAPALEAKLKAYEARSAGSPVTPYRSALLAGGNADRGRGVFFENQSAGCPRCHTIGDSGADVGPKLATIGKTLAREQILQALLEPNARIAPGFGTVSLTLRSGDKIAGTLREETDSLLVVAVGSPAVERRIAKSDVAERTDPASAMPPMGALLKLREIRDVVEFLSGLK
jgi:quinoprotein glucose dehydrogenase